MTPSNPSPEDILKALAKQRNIQQRLLLKLAKELGVSDKRIKELCNEAKAEEEKDMGGMMSDDWPDETKN